ncbi:MAG: thioredoxin domain-containing protein [Bryobacterales bacterium]|nr:thioredoxin domain-containing protein [Bryobacterales bacterium]
MKLIAGIVTLVLSSGWLYGESGPAVVSKGEIEQIVREYILRHPEVLMESVQAYQQRERAAAKQRSREAISAKRRELFEETAAPRAGSSHAGLRIVQFFDYNCGYCRRVSPTIAQLLKERPDVQVIFRELPVLGPESQLAARAALAAQKQGAYLEFHRALMDLKSPVNGAAVEETAARLGLDTARLKADMASAEVQAVLAENQRVAGAIGVRSTPSFVIGHELVSGALDMAGFQALITKALEEKAAAAAKPEAPLAASAGRSSSPAPR